MNTWPGMISRGMLSTVLLIALMSCTEPIARPPAGTSQVATWLTSSSSTGTIYLIEKGGAWTLDIAPDGTVVSKTDMVTDYLEVHDSRTGTVTLEGNAVWFWGFGNDQILTARRWTLDGDEIVSENQTVNGVNATIRFARRPP
jgi:hypothetical protein